ncbi:hypothetical protein [Vibrio harveyi]|uniref:hypothetical protein n=1 Tax=Vibrio harveyi TaxID=669 RepID=UPI003CE95D95
MNNKNDDKYSKVEMLGREQSSELKLYGTFEIYVLMGHTINGIFEPILSSEYYSSHGSHRKGVATDRIGGFYFDDRNRERIDGNPSDIVFGYFDKLEDAFIVVQEHELNPEITDEAFKVMLVDGMSACYERNLYHKDLLIENIKYQDQYSSYMYPFLEKYNFTLEEYFQELWKSTVNAGNSIKEGFDAACEAYGKFFKTEDDVRKNYFEFHNWMRVHGLIELFVDDGKNRYNFHSDDLPHDLQERASEYNMDVQPSQRLRIIIDREKTA